MQIYFRFLSYFVKQILTYHCNTNTRPQEQNILVDPSNRMYKTASSTEVWTRFNKNEKKNKKKKKNSKEDICLLANIFFIFIFSAERK